MSRTDEIWKADALVRTFLDDVRGGVPYAAEQLDAMNRVIDAMGRPVERFVDLGCGNGILARSVLARHPAALAVLVDFSESMLVAARESLRECLGQAQFIVGDFGAEWWQAPIAPFAPFDAVVSGFAIHHQPDERKRHLYREIFTLLRPGGVFVNVEHVASRTPWIESISDGLLIDSLHAFHARARSAKTRQQIADELVYRPDKAANILALVEAQCEWLRAGGFADVDCYFKAFEFAVFGGRRPAA